MISNDFLNVRKKPRNVSQLIIVKQPENITLKFCQIYIKLI